MQLLIVAETYPELLIVSITFVAWHSGCPELAGGTTGLPVKSLCEGSELAVYATPLTTSVS
jgi:hypothetical protein